MRFFKALTYPFSNKAWPVKLGTAVLVAAIPVLGFFLIKGWEFEISVRVKNGDPEPLPGWGKPGGMLVRGVVIRLVGMLYNVPTYILLALSIALWVGVLIRFFGQETRTFEAFIATLAQGSGLRVVAPCGALVYAAAGNILYWTGYLRYIESRKLTAFFEIVPNMRMAFRNILDDIVTEIYVVLMTWMLGMLGSLLTGVLVSTGIGAVLAPIIVPALVLSAMSVFTGHIFGQLAIRTLEG